MTVAEKTVLVIDDSMFMRSVIKRFVTGHGYRVVGEAANGRAGEEKYKELRPDVVTMDYTMDEASGGTALENIIKYDPAANVVMITAMSGQSVISDELRQKGAKAVLSKPFDESALLKVLTEIFVER
jgi:two-component system chemotaxis response regulator CheY